MLSWSATHMRSASTCKTCTLPCTLPCTLQVGFFDFLECFLVFFQKNWFWTPIKLNIKSAWKPQNQRFSSTFWRRRRDSNSRAGLIQPTPLAGEPLRPLGYFSICQVVRFVCGKKCGGESGIRTHGHLRVAGFQDRFLQPLGHLSIGKGSFSGRPEYHSILARSLSTGFYRNEVLSSFEWRTVPARRRNGETEATKFCKNLKKCLQIYKCYAILNKLICSKNIRV